jgi:hypothetical protein
LSNSIARIDEESSIPPAALVVRFPSKFGKPGCHKILLMWLFKFDWVWFPAACGDMISDIRQLKYSASNFFRST